MSALKRWLFLGMLGLALALSGCGFGGNAQEDAEREQVLPGQATEEDEGGEGGEESEGGEGDND
jgi:hypothetical protein